MAKRFELHHETLTLETLFESMPVAMALLDREGRHVALNQALADISGMAPQDLVGVKVAENSEESGENIQRDFRMFDAGLEVPDHELRIGDRIFYVSVKAVRDAHGYAVGEMVALMDITRNKETERQLEAANHQLRFLANHDPLTGVLNARVYYEVSERMMGIARREDTPISVLFIDLDHFKQINDTYGHAAGDMVLMRVADCIQEACRDSDVIGRVGGEEFAAFLPETDHSGALQLAEKLRCRIEALRPAAEGELLRVTASIGVASGLERHKSISDLQRDADHAMYHAKRGGRNRVISLMMPSYAESRDA